ncbi:MAG: DUF6054 family protein [Acholeplasmataceae bacterium]|nr:DUF6054 family protein [Acholeplasmataceae bacterium]
MAKLEKMIYGDFNSIMSDLHNGILSKSISASYEDGSSYDVNGFKSVTRVYERYSYIGSNRVSLTVNLSGTDGIYYLSIITSGGSQAVFFKINTWGENSFLDSIREVVNKLGDKK